MNINKFTQNSIQAINGCEKIAGEYGNTEIMPVHLLYCLLENEDGLIPRILSRSGIDLNGLISAAKEEIEKLPRSSGASQGNIFLSPATNRIFNAAEKLAESMKDDYISVEHLFLAMLDENDTAVQKLFKAFGINKSDFLQELKKVRGNTNVKTDNPEDTYDVLEKYGSDRDHILRAEVYVRDQADVAGFNEVWDAWINPNTSPARYLVVSQLGRPAIRVEVIITAVTK